MGDGYNFKQLKERILALSIAEDWEVARKEWSLIGIQEADEPDTCLCGHFPLLRYARSTTGSRSGAPRSAINALSASWAYALIWCLPP